MMALKFQKLVTITNRVAAKFNGSRSTLAPGNLAGYFEAGWPGPGPRCCLPGSTGAVAMVSSLGV